MDIKGFKEIKVMQDLAEPLSNCLLVLTMFDILSLEKKIQSTSTSVTQQSYILSDLYDKLNKAQIDTLNANEISFLLANYPSEFVKSSIKSQNDKIELFNLFLVSLKLV